MSFAPSKTRTYCRSPTFSIENRKIMKKRMNKRCSANFTIITHSYHTGGCGSPRPPCDISADIFHTRTCSRPPLNSPCVCLLYAVTLLISWLLRQLERPEAFFSLLRPVLTRSGGGHTHAFRRRAWHLERWQGADRYHKSVWLSFSVAQVGQIDQIDHDLDHLDHLGPNLLS